MEVPAAAAAPTAASDETRNFICSKWADCLCVQAKSKCGCGEGCDCGEISVQDVERLMNTECQFSDCKCGLGCGCGKDKCGCDGSTEKTVTEWVETAKMKAENSSGCKCTKVDGRCVCGDTCACGGNC